MNTTAAPEAIDESDAKKQARAQVRSIVEMVAALECDYGRLEELRDAAESGTLIGTEGVELAELEDAAGDCKSRDDAQQRILENALSVEARSGWANSKDDFEPEEFRIVLCTGGPHVELRGDIGINGEPSTVEVHYADWSERGELHDFSTDAMTHGQVEAALHEYCRQFCFGE